MSQNESFSSYEQKSSAQSFEQDQHLKSKKRRVSDLFFDQNSVIVLERLNDWPTGKPINRTELGRLNKGQKVKELIEILTGC